MYRKDIDHWVSYHLKDVCQMRKWSLNHFSWIYAVPCSTVVEVNVNFDTEMHDRDTVGKQTPW